MEFEHFDGESEWTLKSKHGYCSIEVWVCLVMKLLSEFCVSICSAATLTSEKSSTSRSVRLPIMQQQSELRLIKVDKFKLWIGIQAIWWLKELAFISVPSLWSFTAAIKIDWNLFPPAFHESFSLFDFYVCLRLHVHHSKKQKRKPFFDERRKKFNKQHTRI